MEPSTYNSPDPLLIDNLLKSLSQVFLTKEQLARALNVSPKTVMAWRYHHKDFPARKMGRHVRYSLTEVLVWHQNKQGA